MEKLTSSNLKQLFEELPPDKDVGHISNGFSNLKKKEFTCLLRYLVGIVHPGGVKLLQINKLSTKSEEHRYRENAVSVLSRISELLDLCTDSHEVREMDMESRCRTILLCLCVEPFTSLYVPGRSSIAECCAVSLDPPSRGQHCTFDVEAVHDCTHRLSSQESCTLVSRTLVLLRPPPPDTELARVCELVLVHVSTGDKYDIHWLVSGATHGYRVVRSVEVLKHPAKESSSTSNKELLAHLVACCKEAVSQQDKHVSMTEAMEENRDLLASIKRTEQEVETLRGLVNDSVASLNLDEHLKCWLVNEATEISITGVGESLKKRLADVEAVLAALESRAKLAENCRALAECCESRKLSPVYICGLALRCDFPFLESLPDDQFSLENVLGMFVEKLEPVVGGLAEFRTLYDKHRAQERVAEASAQLDVLAAETAERRAELERACDNYRVRYWTAVAPALRERTASRGTDALLEVCRAVSELACLPSVALQAVPPTIKREHREAQLVCRDWFVRPDVPVAAPSYVDFLRLTAAPVGKHEDATASLPLNIPDAPPFSTIKKQHKVVGGRALQKLCRGVCPEGSPVAVTSDGSLDLKFPYTLDKKVQRVLAEEADFPGVYASTPTKFSFDSETSASPLWQISQPWGNSVSGSSEDSDAL